MGGNFKGKGGNLHGTLLYRAPEVAMATARMDVVDLYDQIMACGKASGEKIDALSVVFTLRFKAKQGPPSASISQVV